MKFRTLAEIGSHMTYLLRKRDNVVDPRYRGGLLSWLLEDKGWVTPVWTHLTFYDSERNIVRFRNDITTRFPKSQWPYREPDQFQFELTASLAEMKAELLNEVIDYCNLARRQPKSEFDRHPPCFPIGANSGCYGWTQQAWKIYNKKTKP